MTQTTIYRKDYQPPVFSVTSLALEFDLYDTEVLVTSRLCLKREHPGALHLYGDELELVGIEINGRALDASAYALNDDGLTLKACPDAFELNVVTRIFPQKNTKLSGLYRSGQLFCTQCEAEGFRRMTYFPDRPDVLTQYKTRITADKTQYPVLLSNGNLVESGESDANRHWVVWDDPFKKPSYLFALVAGNLACVSDQFVTQSGRTIELKIYVEPGNEDQCAHAMISLKKAMRWDEERYGREYDLDIFMIVAVSDFNMGAMENKGLNIFNAKFILARPDTATDQDYAAIEGVVAHEYFHNWSGNRVTCRDWFQLSLKEGFTVFRDQEFSRDMNSREVNRIMDVKVLRSAQFPEDAGSMAHPVRPESYQEINNFYTATVYNKGAEVIRMQQTLLGQDEFRKGADLYFQRHDGQAVTIDDFVRAMEDASQVDLTQFKRWYCQAGTPEVEVTSHFEQGTLTLKFQQSCRATAECAQKKPFHIPIQMALFDRQGRPLPIDRPVLELKEAEQTFHFSQFSEKPLVSLLRDFSAPVSLKQDLSQDEQLALLRFETDGFAKWNAAQSLAIDQLVACYQSDRVAWKVPSALIQAHEAILDNEALDPALRAELLMPPGLNEIMERLSKVDVVRLEAVRDFFRKELGQGLWSTITALYQQLWQQETHQMNGKAFGFRKLRNTCLWLMMKADEAQARTLCQKQFFDARTMTDQVASFNLLVNCTDESIRTEAIESFYRQWQHYDLVLDKWLAAQASCELPGTLAAVKSLMSHPAFSFKNPNKVRALIGIFCQANPRHFHAIEGSGYQFLRDILLQMDQINPQIAARLATPFTRWQRFDQARQLLMQQQLEGLSAEKLSPDLREIVDRSYCPR